MQLNKIYPAIKRSFLFYDRIIFDWMVAVVNMLNPLVLFGKLGFCNLD